MQDINHEIILPQPLVPKRREVSPIAPTWQTLDYTRDIRWPCHSSSSSFTSPPPTTTATTDTWIGGQVAREGGWE